MKSIMNMHKIIIVADHLIELRGNQHQITWGDNFVKDSKPRYSMLILVLVYIKSGIKVIKLKV